MDSLEKIYLWQAGRQDGSVHLPWCDRCIPSFMENPRERDGMDCLMPGTAQHIQQKRRCRRVAGGEAASQQDGPGRKQRCKGKGEQSQS